MCRMLLVKSAQPFPIRKHLEIFAALCKYSKEFQGHGWGIAYVEDNKRKLYKNVQPIWQHNFQNFGETTFMLVHARSAFRDKDIVVDNNMPFVDERYSFAFNGELHGVKIKAPGRIGAEKIFNYIKRFDNNDMSTAFKKGIKIIRKQTRYIKAMNILLTDMQRIYLYSLFHEDADYFAMHKKRIADTTILCSQPYPGEDNWLVIPNATLEVWR